MKLLWPGSHMLNVSGNKGGKQEMFPKGRLQVVGSPSVEMEAPRVEPSHPPYPSLYPEPPPLEFWHLGPLRLVGQTWSQEQQGRGGSANSRPTPLWASLTL